MASPSVASTGTTNDSFATTLTLAPPSGIADGDLLEALFYVYQQTANDPTRAGWTKKVDVNDAGDLRLVTLYRYASSESGSYAFTLTGAVYWGGVVRRITGAVTAGDPYDTVGTKANASNAAPAASATTTQADTLISWYEGNFSTGVTVTVPPTGISGTQGTAFYVGAKAQASIGSTGSLSGTLSGSDSWIAVVSAIKSPVSSSTTYPFNGRQKGFFPGRQ